MGVRIAVVEDNDRSAGSIREYLKKYEADSGESFNIVRFTDGDEIAYDYKPVYDIIFLDIQMKRLDGMSTAECIRKMDGDVILIFITNMAQYAIKGYAVGALDFLLKPVPYFAFSQQIKRSLERLKSKEKHYLLLPTDDGVVKMDVSQVFYIESFRHKMQVYTRQGDYTISSTMKELEELSGKSFFRCNNCYLFNLTHVKKVSGATVTVDKYDLIISRPRKKAFMEALAGYVGGVTK